MPDEILLKALPLGGGAIEPKKDAMILHLDDGFAKRFIVTRDLSHARDISQPTYRRKRTFDPPPQGGCTRCNWCVRAPVSDGD